MSPILNPAPASRWRRRRATGRPLEFVDVALKVVETAAATLRAAWLRSAAARAHAVDSARRISEANALRRVARAHERHARGLSGDLRAAADRHDADLHRLG